ncbi:hypothetical protein EV356DRAFT_510724 [Viridothelium virens]|uniref:Uncharacterized protein n=1 Tax=Viridothelium virens TaxID=1048519 RepID=A0A6A6HIR7_VIRVR|nr:hypothetical protein EV356DRAFT_510724 [Viridothelium virens]
METQSATFKEHYALQTFEWIDQSRDGHVPKGATRRAIRRHAMRSAGTARKQGGVYGKTNLRQEPVFVDEVIDQPNSSLPRSQSQSQSWSSLPSPEQDAGNSMRSDTYRYGINDTFQAAGFRPSTPIPASLSSTGYQLLKQEYGVDLARLATLAEVHFGRATCRILSQQPSILKFICSDDTISYLRYVPALYDHCALIQAVTRCTLARMQQCLSPSPTALSASVLKHYEKALQRLQQALNDPACLYEPVVLCATQILALFELLNFSENGAWIRHVAGAARLIELRGPQGYRTEFEKALFMAQAGPLFSESLLNNEACFLERPEWQVVVKSMAIGGDKFGSRSQLSISLWMMKYRVPGLMRRTTELVCSDKHVDPCDVERLLQEARDLRKRFQEWRFTYDCIMENRTRQTMRSCEYNKARNLLAVCVTDLVLMARIIFALDPVNSSEMEDEAQAMGGLIVALEQEAATISVTAALFMTQKLAVAQAIMATEHDWRKATWQQITDGRGRKMIDRQVFERWCTLLGRKTT